ncbi:MAG: glutamine--tRNA ligase/YqeY domain fusion protein [Acidobacteria bacterium]|nr:glutamine--tRNA ligase/YqeY domain fusion protein [Acidobacteriota bacterium]
MKQARGKEGDGEAVNGPGSAPGADPPPDFIRAIVAADRAAGKHDGRVGTRFPPEPNGFLHIGHAKSIVLNFGVAAENGGACNLRYDDTNPAKEETLYVESIADDVRWLGYQWEGQRRFASDYFERLYEFAETLIRRGKAYVDSLSAEEVRQTRGTLESPGTGSPYRNRTIDENLDLFRRMRAGEFPDGAHVLRARIDMASGNLNLRDPTLYRIRRLHHHRTGDEWCIYPMYDFAHALSDSIEGITHSLCTLEFEDHRPLYDWCVAESQAEFVPRQIEFARLNVSYTVLSKRRLLRLVSEGHVSGWDDPRMPTIAGLRRRGVPPAAIRAFCERVGVAKRDSTVDIALLEHAVREELNRTSPRLLGVLDPVRLVVENYPEDGEETFEAVNNPEDPAAGTRQVPFSRELLVERADFMEDPPRKFYRLAPGREVRLRYAFLVTCTGFSKDRDGRVQEIRCRLDPESRGGDAPDGRRVRATLHWVSARHAVPVKVRLCDRLFRVEEPGRERDFVDDVNPDSMRVNSEARIDPAVRDLNPGARIQLERLGYFVADSADHLPESPVLNRTVSLRDTWARIVKRGRRP